MFLSGIHSIKIFIVYCEMSFGILGTLISNLTKLLNVACFPQFWSQKLCCLSFWQVANKISIFLCLSILDKYFDCFTHFTLLFSLEKGLLFYYPLTLSGPVEAKMAHCQVFLYSSKNRSTNLYQTL